MKQTANNNEFLREMKDKYRRYPVCYAQILRTMNRDGEEAAREKARRTDEQMAAWRAERTATGA